MRAILLLIVLGTAVSAFTVSAVEAAPDFTGPTYKALDPAAIEAARMEALHAPALPPEQWEYPPQFDAGYRDRLGYDANTSHYGRGLTLIVHIFINDPSHTFTGDEMNTAGGRSDFAKQFYLTESPWGANMSFDGAGGYLYYNPTISWTVPNDPSWQTANHACEDACAALGIGDGNGDGSRMDDLTFLLQNWGGGWDNVIVVFEPHVDGRAFSDFNKGRCVLYTNDDGSVFAHEWGHNFHACDEYAENGHCWNCDCGPCVESWYIQSPVNNGNCELASCPLNNDCVMKYNSTWLAPCVYSQGSWSWTDSNGDGYLNDVKRHVGDGAYVMIYELFHNGYFYWNGVNDGMVLSQRWRSWNAVGLRSPAGGDYDLTLYGDNNHNFQYASCSYGTGSIDFVVGDYNHSAPSNEHVAVTHYSGNWDAYNLTWEGGSEMLYADGIPRSEGWLNANVVRVWDVPVFANEPVSFNLTNPSGNLNFGLALFASNGQPYWASRDMAQRISDANGIGGAESFTYTSAVDDVVGLVVWANNVADGDLTIQVGPSQEAMNESVVYTRNDGLHLYNYTPYNAYWTFVGTRGLNNTAHRLSLYDDPSFLNLKSQVSGTGLQFFASDGNHGYDTDYLRVVRTYGSGSHESEWEQGANIHSGLETLTWTSPHLGKMWDVNLAAGTEYFFREYHSTSGSLDTGIYMFSSVDGILTKNGNESAASGNTQPPSAGGEWFAYTPPQSDWYGFCETVAGETSGNTQLWYGPRLDYPENTTFTRTERVLWGREAVSRIYWNIMGVRAPSGSTAAIDVFSSDNCSESTHLAGDGPRALSFVFGDFNHDPTGTYYSRTYRVSTSGTVTHQWEGGGDQLQFTPGGTWTTDLTWQGGYVVKMWDMHISAPPAHCRIEVIPLSGTMDFGILAASSYGYSTYWGNRDSGISADLNGPGGTEALSLIFNVPDWFGVAIWCNNEVNGSYRIRVIDTAGGDVATEAAGAAPFDFRVSGPNPFRTSAGIQYSLPASGPVEVAIYDARGCLVRWIERGEAAAGVHGAIWDGRDESGAMAGSGVYFARLQAGGKERRLKLVRVE